MRECIIRTTNMPIKEMMWRVFHITKEIGIANTLPKFTVFSVSVSKERNCIVGIIS